MFSHFDYHFSSILFLKDVGLVSYSASARLFTIHYFVASLINLR